MTNQHPVNIIANTITKWRTYYRKTYKGNLSEIDYIAANAAQWGADQELEACCEVLTDKCFVGQATLLREWRRPKPPSLKEQALDELHLSLVYEKGYLKEGAADIIRRALEALDD